jgi:hypothetical protein
MNRALFYLYTRSLAGSLRQRARRLRQPKYLFGALFGAVYFYGYFFRFLFLRNRGASIASEPSALGENIGALMLFGAVLFFAWIIPGKRTALGFSEAEIATLFPAPLTRRELVRYKLLTSQIGIFIFAGLMTLITGRGASGSGWLHLAGWWVIILIFSLHRLGASFAITRLMERGMANWQRRLALCVAVLALAGTLAAWRAMAPAPPELKKLAHRDAISDYLSSVLLAGPGPWLLLPFRTVVRPYFAADWAAFLRALPPALGLLALHYWWVMRADVSFEEATIAFSQKRAALIAARQRGDLRVSFSARSAKVPVFALRPVGFPPVAFVWKALLYSGGMRAVRIWMIVAGAVLAVSVALTAARPSDSVALGIGISGVSTFLVVLLANSTTGASYLRQDLGAMDLLQTFPVRGWHIISGQLFAQAALGALIQWAALIMIAIGLFGVREIAAPHAAQISAALAAAAVLALPFNLTMMIVPAGALLLWPGWFKVGPQAAGFESMGLRLILVLGQLLAMLAALIVPGLAGGLVWFAAATLRWGAAGILLAAIAAALVLAVEVFAGIRALGLVFERFDVSAEG